MRLTDYQRGSIFGLVIAVVAFGFACWPSSNNKPTDQQTGSQTAAHPEKKREHKIARWWAWTISGDSSGFYTFGLIFVGMAQAGSFIWQIVLIREGLSDTQETADAAKEQAQLARESLIASQRAWIKVEGVILSHRLRIDVESMRTTVGFRLANVGNAPALKVTPWVSLGVMRCDGMEVGHLHRHCVQIVKRLPPGEFAIFPGDGVPSKEGGLIVSASIHGTAFEEGTQDMGNGGSSCR